MSEASAGDPDRVTALGESELIELRVKGSRFLARVHPTPDRESLDRALARERAEFPDATHHCYGARLLTEERSDDDGEPGGTAGPPILRAVEARGVRGVACVVIRYYGGTKLGTGGLIRAYGDAAREALAVAPTSVVWRTTTMRVEVDFADLGAVEVVLRQVDADLLGTDRHFNPDPGFELQVKTSRVDPLREAMRDATAGRAVVTVLPPSEDLPGGSP